VKKEKSEKRKMKRENSKGKRKVKN